MRGFTAGSEVVVFFYCLDLVKNRGEEEVEQLGFWFTCKGWKEG